MKQQTTAFKSGFIAFLGRPNSGKSTLMNNILEEQISIVTPLPQTTRQNIRGIFTSDKMQLVFVDTPGIHKGKYSFNEVMIQQAANVLKEQEVDLVCYMVDLSRKFGEEEGWVAQMVVSYNRPVLIVFNKTDLCPDVEKKKREFFGLFPKLNSFPQLSLSAIDNEAKVTFLNIAEKFIPQGPPYFDQDTLTDAPMRFIASEFIRKHVILNTREEVPHATFVEIESYKESKKGHEITATIHVETNGQRGIIVGKKGFLIQKIKRDAKEDLKNILEQPVSLSLHVKVTPNWRDNKNFLRHMGMH
ncbi:GTPase Era [Chitinispirillales bacterium ANBcel5]|uniref:GTPase Era n=1 Tax=Cellulosispirillum alkaliphilum TaxID=3039283 RepID=UPI002A57FDBD|nr:GTPase Era [Chitinispirillales bacterium ANBcel5]